MQFDERKHLKGSKSREREKFKMADSKFFSTSSKTEQFLPKFHGLVLGLVGLIDANMSQPISL